MLDDDFVEQESTIGMEISSMNRELPNGAILKINILDTGGAEMYRDIVTQYFDDIHVVVLVFSMNDITSLQELTEWNEILKDRGITRENHILIVVGNKLDLLADPKLNQKLKKKTTPPLSRRLKSRFATDITLKETPPTSLPADHDENIASWNALEHHNMTEKAKAFASSIGAYYIEVSALSGQNIKSFDSVLPKLAGTFFEIKPRLMKHGKRKKEESSISMLKQKYGDIDEQSCQCIIS
jgi:small GTP-binding protein